MHQLEMTGPSTETDGALFLSRLRLNLRSREVRADLRNSQAMHRRMLDAFPGVPDRASVGLLYRIEPPRLDRTHSVLALVQSRARPDWSRLPESYLLDDDGFGWAVDEAASVKDITAVYAAIRQGETYRFRLRASPTKRIPWHEWARQHPETARDIERSGRAPNGPRVPVTVLTGRDLELPPEKRPSADDKLREWIVRKGELHGFSVGGVQARPDPLTGDMQHGTKTLPDANDVRLAHKAIVFEGLLHVSDADRFRLALRNGVGGGKAYGFGLLSIACVEGGSQ